jgi:hypothetical protein
MVSVMAAASGVAGCGVGLRGGVGWNPQPHPTLWRLHLGLEVVGQGCRQPTYSTYRYQRKQDKGYDKPTQSGEKLVLRYSKKVCPDRPDWERCECLAR